MRGQAHFRMHANRWLMPAILLIGFACIIVWVWRKFRQYRKAVDERQAIPDMLNGRSSRELDKDDIDI
jgi:hypothetical protein